VATGPSSSPRTHFFASTRFSNVHRVAVTVVLVLASLMEVAVTVAVAVGRCTPGRNSCGLQLQSLQGSNLRKQHLKP
jgi:hypothetical protein